MDADTESYILLLLGDGNLPTGSFVASSGLESYEKHGFFGLPQSQTADSPPVKTGAIISFIRDSVQAYAHSSLPFILGAYEACETLRSHDNADSPLPDALESVIQLDSLYEAMTLNHVTRRASTSQGVALLTLLLKGLVLPAWMGTGEPGKRRVEALADSFKLEIRRGAANGHLPVCWGILTAALGLSQSESFNTSPAISTRLI